jgi:hypothetical protein
MKGAIHREAIYEIRKWEDKFTHFSHEEANLHTIITDCWVY